MNHDTHSVFQEMGRWFFIDHEKRRRGPYLDEGNARAKMASVVGDHKLVQAGVRLARMHLNDPLVSRTLLRLGFGNLGGHRLEDHHEILTPGQRKELARYHVMSAGPKDVTDAELMALGLKTKELARYHVARLQPPHFYQQSERLFKEFVDNVPWKEECDRLSDISNRLTDLIVWLLSNPFIDREQFKSWEWAGFVFGIISNDVGSRLKISLHENRVSTPELIELGKLANAHVFFPHLWLIRKTLMDYFILNLTSFDTIRDQFIATFQSSVDRDEVREEVLNHIDSCRRGSVDFVACARNRRLLRTRIHTETVAQLFLGFKALSCRMSDEDARKLVDSYAGKKANSSRTSIRARVNRIAGPRMIDYADCKLSSQPMWECSPIGARILPAQGSTRDPRGHRA